MIYVKLKNIILNFVSLLQFLRTTCAVVTFLSTANKLETVRHYTLQITLCCQGLAHWRCSPALLYIIIAPPYTRGRAVLVLL